MKTGDTVRDGRGKTWQIGTLLGRGTWGRSWLVRGDHPGDEAVLKVPYSEADLGGDEVLAGACREILLEQARWLAEGRLPGVVPVLDRFTLADGTPALLMPHKGQGFERRSGANLSVEEILGIGMRLLERLQELGGTIQVHGNLKPGNVLVSDTGEVWLCDPVTPVFRRHQAELRAVLGGDRAWAAPEVREPDRSPLPLSVPADTWSVALLMVLALGTGTERFPDLPVDGLDKVRVTALKDRIVSRLRKEPSNPRFHTRLSERLVAVLNRALSRETSPSPPYRFKSIEELLRRLEEVRALARPSVQQVGRFILDLRPGVDHVTTEDKVKFTVSVSCSAGVESHEEISSGIALFDEDKGERVRSAECTYNVDRHPSGRFRFSFTIEPLAPGTYRARVAFRVRDSQEDPTTVEGVFQVRAAAGYVPPRVVPAPTPLAMERDEPTAATDPGLRPTARPRNLQATPEPRPIAPVAPVEAPTQVVETPVRPASADLSPPSRMTGPVAPVDLQGGRRLRESPPPARPVTGQPTGERPSAAGVEKAPARAQEKVPERAPERPVDVGARPPARPVAQFAAEPPSGEKQPQARLPGEKAVLERPSDRIQAAAAERAFQERHAADRPTVDRPSVDRPSVDRPSFERSSTDRSVNDRPTVPSASLREERPVPYRAAETPRVAPAEIASPKSRTATPSAEGRRTEPPAVYLEERRTAPPQRATVLPAGGTRSPKRANEMENFVDPMQDPDAFADASWGPLPEANSDSFLPEPRSLPPTPERTGALPPPEEEGPLGALISRIVALVRGDSYVWFMLALAAIVGVLAVVFFFTK